MGAGLKRARRAATATKRRTAPKIGARTGCVTLFLPITRGIDQRGIELVKAFEGCSLIAYRDEVGVYTIGFGHTGLQHNDGTVYPGRRITQQQAEQLLTYDLHQFESRVSAFVKVPLTDDEFSALTSFDFNTGALGKSTLLRLLNERDYAGAAKQFGRWVYAGGVKYRGLVRRRESERNLFLGETPYIVEEVKAVRGRVAAGAVVRRHRGITVEGGLNAN